jgi:NADH-quinone oxidoreductase subunit C
MTDHATDAAALVSALTAALGGEGWEASASQDQPTIYVTSVRLLETCRYLRDTPGQLFRLLADVTAVDWLPREPRYEVVYHLSSPEERRRLRIKTRVSGADPHVPTVAAIWPAAGWLEREVWDLFGIVFDDHPDLRRLLMPDDWEGHPLRKDYPVQIRLAANASEPLQVSEEEFKARLEADRHARTRRS